MRLHSADVIIVGAGISGLLAARRLMDAGARVTMFERAAAPGGRLATRQLGDGLADSGAQFFTVRTPEFLRIVDEWLSAGWVFTWAKGWSDGLSAAFSSDGFPRYAARGGFAALAQHISEAIDVRYATGVARISYADGWRLTTENGQQFHTRALLLTPPVPLSLSLLRAGGVALPPDDERALERIRYLPCLSVLLQIEGEITLPPPGAIQRPDSDVAWIADNQAKGISAARIVTAHANPAASALRWAMSDGEIVAWMAAELAPWLDESARIVDAFVERWPHAIPEAMHPERCLVLHSPGPLAFAGDAFNGPRVEGAALSGLAAAEKMIEPRLHAN